MSEKHSVGEHEQTIHVVATVELPPHEARTESSLFKKNKRLLVEEHGFGCAAPACGSHDKLEVHHIAEWCGATWYDFDLLKEFLHYIDPYGFSKAYARKPLESVDDIRNLIVLCARCHRERPFAIHKVPFPQFVMQAVVKSGHSFESQEIHEELKRRNEAE